MKTKNFYVAACLGLAQMTLLDSKALAQQRPVADLDEVVVTASRSPKKISEIGKVVRVISAETLAKSQGRTLPEVLNNIAGITIGGNGSNPADVKAVYMRGASAANTLILIDGIPGEVYNVCSGKGITSRALLKQLIKESNKKLNIIEDKQFHSIKDIHKIIGCNQKIMQLMGD